MLIIEKYFYEIFIYTYPRGWASGTTSLKLTHFYWFNILKDGQTTKDHRGKVIKITRGRG